MAEPRSGESGGVYTIEPWHNGRATVTATGSGPAAVLAGGLSGVLSVHRGELETPRFADEATTALPLRAEAADVAALFVALVTALLDETESAEYEVRAVQFDGIVHTDDGLTGWGYALAAPGAVTRQSIALEETLLTEDGGLLTLRATVRRKS